jgi:hypothetical protein
MWKSRQGISKNYFGTDSCRNRVSAAPSVPPAQMPGVTPSAALRSTKRRCRPAIKRRSPIRRHTQQNVFCATIRAQDRLPTALEQRLVAFTDQLALLWMQSGDIRTVRHLRMPARKTTHLCSAWNHQITHYVSCSGRVVVMCAMTTANSVGSTGLATWMLKPA